MKKVNSVKKKNLKLRKQIRRTLGALFMISAIVVAAIPVQDLQAVDLFANTQNDSRKEVEYQVGLDLTMDGSQYLKPEGKPELVSYVVRSMSGGSWSLNWQFKYYIVSIGGSEMAIISKYNDMYPEKEVKLSNSANAGYYTVTSSQFDTFYTTGAGNTDYQFSYAREFKDYKSSGRTTPDMDWIKKYRENEYNTFMATCEAYFQYEKDKAVYDIEYLDYQRKLADYIAGGSIGEKPKEPNKPIEPTKPTELKFNPSADFSNEEKYKLYCDIASALPPQNVNYLPGTGYTLVSVTDDRPTDVSGQGTAVNVYVAKGGQPIQPAYNDSEGFLVTQASTNIIGIANRAFTKVSNVDTLDLPNELKYIGDSAFEGSFIKSINMANIENIGNRAFKDCTELYSAVMSSTKRIGVESFKNSGITSISFPYSLSEIGDGAFAECKKLGIADLSKVNTACTIGQYAFFNDYALNSVEMVNTGIVSIGEGAFALTASPTGSWKDVKLPMQITGGTGSELGDVLFAGRSNLNSIKFPTNYGTNNIAEIPSGMFRNCANLKDVDFSMGAGSITNGQVKYNGSLLFADVTNPDICVMGPEKNLGGQTAAPRSSTWTASTKVSNFVPYVYINAQGVKCYEVSDGVYLMQANENGELTSCELIDRTATSFIDPLVIPSKVGNYPIKTIANGCFDDELLRDKIKSIVIEDDSIIKLDDSVFSNLKNLKSVQIGNSVQSIGNKAFYNCEKLEEVTFHTPSIGHEGFTIGTDAFKTNSNKLTFNGDIVPGYAPFEFALGKDSGVIETEGGKRICYKSLSPDFLTVMYDNKTGDVTLLDYPKYSELDTKNTDYCLNMEQRYTNKYGTGQADYNSKRDEFAQAWVSASSDEDRENLYSSLIYGPWIDPSYVAANGGYEKYLTDNSITTGVSKPKAFYELIQNGSRINAYSITGNYERGSAARGEFEAVTDKELQWINACHNVAIPAGVTSIDATRFFNATENTRNVTTYFDSSSDGYKSYKMCTDSNGGTVVPGLFSGYLKDYDESSDLEKEVKGNDRILSITMSDVKYLPDYAFDDCEQLKSMTLGAACAEMGKAPFRGCDAMTDITGNDHFVIDNRIIYSVNADKTYTIKECLPSRGTIDSKPGISLEEDPNLAKVSTIVAGAFEDCDHITRVYLTDATKLKVIPENCFNNCDLLQAVNLPESVNRIEDKAFGGNKSISVTIPGREVHIVKDAFEHEPTNTIYTYKGTSAEDYGHFYNIYVDYLKNQFTVDFVNYDGTNFAPTQHVEEGKDAKKPEDVPKKEGYTFVGWLGDYTNVTKNLIIYPDFKSNSSSDMVHTVTFYAFDGTTVVSKQDNVKHEGEAVAPIPPTVSGYKFKEWSPKTYLKVTKDLDIMSVYEKDNGNSGGSGGGNGSPSPSPSVSPTPSPSPDAAKKYTVSVSGGSGSGSYAAGAIVSINAYAMGEGYTFDKWTTSTAGVGFASNTSLNTTFTMPSTNVAITATYKTGNAGSANTPDGSAGSGQTGGSGSSGSGNAGTSGGTSGTTVEVDRPGISNTDLAGATVSGATDNFVVKIKETQEATDAAVAALQAKYGDISKIKYLPMDISLYDSEGRNKITDTTGISVNITLPLPDDLVAYAGNSKIASAAGGTIEDLTSKFATINGVPCINFTATHFSPYVIYVDTANLTEGTIDTTPKTGDMLHPKWFLAMGLACISLILFFKKDRSNTKIKAAVPK